MDVDRLVERLSFEWLDDDGFLQETRRGVFHDLVIGILSSGAPHPGELMD